MDTSLIIESLVRPPRLDVTFAYTDVKISIIFLFLDREAKETFIRSLERSLRSTNEILSAIGGKSNVGGENASRVRFVMRFRRKPHERRGRL